MLPNKIDLRGNLTVMFGWKKAVGKVISADRQKLESSYSFQHDPHAGHPVLVAKMNRYFAGHPVEGERFRREMEFINELPKSFRTRYFGKFIRFSRIPSSMRMILLLYMYISMKKRICIMCCMRRKGCTIHGHSDP